jgi:dCTP deaminase
VEDGIVEIDPFEPSSVQAASIDLRLDDFIIAMDGRSIDISAEQSFALHGGQTVNVRTKEYIRFPDNYIGRVGAMTRLAKYGIILSHGFQVDPGFAGPLQFCLFNAGGSNYVLRSGDPIISMEIIPLATRPLIVKSTRERTVQSGEHDRPEVRSHFGGAPVSTCGQLVHEFVERFVETEIVHDMVSAKIPRLEIEVVGETREAVIDSVVFTALGTLKSISENADTVGDLKTKYETFFAELAERFHLDASAARNVVRALNFELQAPDNFVVLNDGTGTILRLPKSPAKITMKSLAEQLRLPAHELFWRVAPR